MNISASAINVVYDTLTGRTELQRNHQEANIWRIHALLLFMSLAMVIKRWNYSLLSDLQCILFSSSPSPLLRTFHFPNLIQSENVQFPVSQPPVTLIATIYVFIYSWVGLTVMQCLIELFSIVWKCDYLENVSASEIKRLVRVLRVLKVQWFSLVSVLRV